MNQENNQLENVFKSCKTASKILQVLIIIVTVAMILCMVAAGGCFAFHKQIGQAMVDNPEVFNSTTFSVSEHGIQYTANASDMTSPEDFGLSVASICLVGGISLIFVKIVLHMMRRIFSVILDSESPFSEKVIKTLRRSFILLTVYIGLTTGLGSAAFVGVFLWCIYKIFQYGASLQQQADETL